MIRIQLSKLLGEKRLTQADIARMTGIRAGTINDLYHEIATRISLEHLDLLCEALDCDISCIRRNCARTISRSQRLLIRRILRWAFSAHFGELFQ